MSHICVVLALGILATLTGTVGPAAAAPDVGPNYAQAVVDAAQDEVDYWQNGVRRECPDDRNEDPRISDYWDTARFNGNGCNTAWSAAFISYVQQEAGAGNAFFYTASHSNYIGRSIIAQRSGDRDALYWGVNADTNAAKPGDIACNGGEVNSSWDYDDFVARRNQNYNSHCDVIVAVNGRSIDVVGGNVSPRSGQARCEFGQSGCTSNRKTKDLINNYAVLMQVRAGDGGGGGDFPPFKGVVSDTRGTRIQSVAVDLFTATGDGSRGSWIRQVNTNSNGYYELPAGSGCWVLVFIAPNGRTWRDTGSKWYQRAHCLSSSEKWISPILNTTDGAGVRLRGVVEERDGDRVSGVSVDLFTATGDGSRGAYQKTASTNGNGYYEMTMGSGCWVIVAIAPNGRTWRDTASKWYERAFCRDSGDRWISPVLN